MITSRLGYDALLCLMALLVAGLMIAGIIAGTVTLPVRQVMAALTGREAWVPDMVARIVIELRLPRSVLTAATGAGFAMVGAYLQTATRWRTLSYSVSLPAPRRARCSSSPV